MNTRHTVTLSNGQQFDVAPRQSLLQAALAAGLNWPNGCRVGLCGSCRCRITRGRGRVRALSDASPVLDRRQRDDGYVLACRSLLSGSVSADAAHLLADGAATGERAATVADARRVSPTVAELVVTLDAPFEHGFEAGQYTRLGVPGRVPPRCFSFAGACDGGSRLRFYIRLFPGGRFGEWLLGADRRGARVEVAPPLGAFTLRDGSRPLLFFAAGTGIAPVLAMIEQLAARPGEPPPLRLVYAARDRRHLFADAALDALMKRWSVLAPFNYCPVLSREPAGSVWTGRRGYAFDRLDELLAGFDDADVYLCGPPGYVDALELYLLKAGLPRTRLNADRFLPAF